MKKPRPSEIEDKYFSIPTLMLKVGKEDTGREGDVRSHT